MADPAAELPVQHGDGPFRPSPLVRRLSVRYGLTRDTIPGSGHGGRVTARDLRGAAAARRRTPARGSQGRGGPHELATGANVRMPQEPAKCREQWQATRGFAAIAVCMAEVPLQPSAADAWETEAVGAVLACRADAHVNGWRDFAFLVGEAGDVGGVEGSSDYAPGAGSQDAGSVLVVDLRPSAAHIVMHVHAELPNAVSRLAVSPIGPRLVAGQSEGLEIGLRRIVRLVLEYDPRQVPASAAEKFLSSVADSVARSGGSDRMLNRLGLKEVS